MSDQYQETYEISWFSRIKQAFVGILFGLVLFIGAFPLLMWNEGRTLQQFNTLEEGEKSTIEIEASSIDTKNNEQLVYLNGLAETEEILNDTSFDIKINAIKLKRQVEMYQWKENQSETKEKQLGGSEKIVVTYSYEKVWSNNRIASSNFEKQEYKNPSSMPYQSNELTASKVNIGKFLLNRSLKSDIRQSTHLPVDRFYSTEQLEAKGWQLDSGSIYIGAEPSLPTVGDVRVKFYVVHPQQVSVIAKQKDQFLNAYKTKSGGEIEMLALGVVSKAQMYKKAQETNTLIAWGIRVGGALLMMFGIGLFLRPISVVGDIVPFFGTILEFGISLIAFMLGLVLSIITIAIAWFAVRPLISIALIGTAIALLMLFKLKKRKAPQLASD